MALATYADLLASIAAWMNRTDLTTVIPDFVTLAESRIARDLRLRMQIINTTQSTVAGARAIALPSDWLEFENVGIAPGSAASEISYTPAGFLDSRYPDNGTTGKPVLYALQGSSMQLAPTPDSVYVISLVYYARFPALATAGTNWLMANFPAVYLHAAMNEAALFTMNDERAAHWDAMYQSSVKAVQHADEAALTSGSGLRVRKV